MLGKNWINILGFPVNVPQIIWNVKNPFGVFQKHPIASTIMTASAALFGKAAYNHSSDRSSETCLMFTLIGVVFGFFVSHAIITAPRYYKRYQTLNEAEAKCIAVEGILRQSTEVSADEIKSVCDSFSSRPPLWQFNKLTALKGLASSKGITLDSTFDTSISR